MIKFDLYVITAKCHKMSKVEKLLPSKHILSNEKKGSFMKTNAEEINTCDVLSQSKQLDLSS